MKKERKFIHEKLKGFASRLHALDTEIANCNTLLNDLGVSLKSYDFDNVGVKSACRDSIVEQSVSVRDKYISRIQRATCEKDKTLQEFAWYIEPLGVEKQQILRYKYLDGLKSREIARKLFLSESRIMHLLGMSQEVLYRHHMKK